MAEQLICNQQVAGSSPIASSKYNHLLAVDGFPSGQREQTVNLPSQTSMVRIHPHPPFFVPREWRNWQTRTVQVRVLATTCRFKSCFPHQTNIIRTYFQSVMGSDLLFSLTATKRPISATVWSASRPPSREAHGRRSRPHRRKKGGRSRFRPHSVLAFCFSASRCFFHSANSRWPSSLS